MKDSIRFFNCARCRAQVFICSDCDRGNIYCATKCSRLARTNSIREANQRYQKSYLGRQKHAERQRRYRQRQRFKKEIVTDQGSLKIEANDLISEVQLITKMPLNHCHFCGEPCLTFVRQGYLKQRSRERKRYWAQGP